MTAHGIMFHHFHDGKHALHGGKHSRSQGSISAEDLDAIIRFLDRRRILPAREWMWRAITGGLGEQDLCLTFDDSLRCQYDVALPVLQRHGITAFWFVYTSVIEGQPERLELYRKFRTVCFASVDDFYESFFNSLGRHEWAARITSGLANFDPRNYLTAFGFYTDADRTFRYARDELLGPERYHQAMDAMIADQGISLSELAQDLWMDGDCLGALQEDDHVIGLHSHTHPTRLENLCATAQLEEYETNYRALTTVLGEPPLAMSHPCNSYNSATLRILRGLGIVLGFRANMAHPASSALEHPREDHANVLAGMRQSGADVRAGVAA